jgi:acetyl esterase/lipase
VSRSVLSRAAPGPDLVVRYGEHEDQVADVRLPPGDVDAVLFLLHGGFWRQAFDRTHLAPLAVALARQGLAVVTPEYRRVGGAGGWPATFDDVRTCCARLPALLGEAAPGTAGRRVVLAGHSAGGHLALWAAAVAPPEGLTAVVGLAAVADLRQADRDGLGEQAAAALLGVDADPRRWAAADPVQLPAPAVPVTLIHGRRDTVVPLGQAYAYRTAHPAARILEPDVGHFAPIDPTSPASLAHLWPALFSPRGGQVHRARPVD